jgi:hypothetical protein
MAGYDRFKGGGNMPKPGAKGNVLLKRTHKSAPRLPAAPYLCVQKGRFSV